MVRAEVQLQCRDTQLTPEKMKIVAPAILSKLMTSEEMEECLGGLRTEMAGAANEMSSNFDRELVLMSQLRDSQQMQRPLTRNSSGLSDSLSSTWNQSTFIFLQPSQYARLAEKLNPYSAAEDRIEALNTLLVTQISECIGTQCWPLIKDGLQAALIDTNVNVASLSMKIHARMLTNVTPFCTKEAFTSLTQTIVSLYRDKTRSHILPALASEISFKKRPNHGFLQICKLISTVCKDLPKYWPRYAHSHIEHMMKAMIELVSLKGRGGQKILSPIHLISLVDPKAQWLKAWLHGNLGRKIFFDLVGKMNDNLFIKAALHHLLLTLDKGSFPLLSRSSGRKKGLLSSSLVSFAFFSHNLNVIVLALQYREGQKIFPVSLPQRDEPVDGMTVIKHLVNFVANGHQVSHQTTSRLITKALVSLGQTNQNVNKYFINDKVVDTMIVPLLNWTQHPQSSIALNLCKLLELLFKSPSGLDFALGVKIEASGLHLPDFMLSFTLSFLTSMSTLSHQNEAVMMAALSTCRYIVMSHACALTVTFQAFVKGLSEAYFDIDDLSAVTPTNSMANIAIENQATELKARITDVLKATIKTPRGLYTVAGIDGLLQTLVQESKINMEDMLLTAFTANGRFTIEENSALELSKNELVKILIEYDVKEWQPTGNTNEDKVFKIMASLVMMLSDAEALTSHEEELKILFPFDDSPLLVQDETMLPLRLLIFVMADLDLRMNLLANHDMKTKLNNLMETFKTDDGVIMVDKGSTFLQYLNESLSQLGGPTERKLISLTPQKNSRRQLVKVVKEKKLSHAQDLAKFLKDHKHGEATKDKKWRNEVVKLFRKNLTMTNSIISPDVMADLFYQINCNNADHDPNVVDFPRMAVKLTKEDDLAIDAFATYSKKNLSSDISSQDMSQIMKYSKKLLNKDQRDSYEGVDWTVLVIFALLNGNVPNVQNILKSLTNNFEKSAVWFQDNEALVSKIGHHVEMILTEETPLIIPSLRENNIPVALIVMQWMKQVYLNVLDWNEISNYAVILSLYGPDYQVYFCASIFRHLRDVIVDQADQDLLQLLRCDPVQGFYSGDYLPYMEQLEHRYRHLVLKDLYL
jgi:hypothetical protein